MDRPTIDIDLKLKTAWLRNLPLFKVSAEDAESLAEYVKSITLKGDDYKFTVEGLSVTFFVDIPITGFVEWAFIRDSNFLPDDTELFMVNEAVRQAISNGLLDMIVVMAKQSIENLNKNKD